MGKVDTPHFRLPFQVTGTHAAYVEQDSLEEIAQCVEAVAKTPVRTRIENPAYGVNEELFRMLPADSTNTALIAAIEEFEPRAKLLGEKELSELTETIRLRVST